jgi:hypothetical protein
MRQIIASMIVILIALTAAFVQSRSAAAEHPIFKLLVSIVSDRCGERGGSLEAIFNKDPGAVRARNADGDTPLHIAAKYGFEDAVKMLLKRGANKKAKNKRGLTPIDVSRKQCRLQIMPNKCGLVEKILSGTYSQLDCASLLRSLYGNKTVEILWEKDKPKPGLKGCFMVNLRFKKYPQGPDPEVVHADLFPLKGRQIFLVIVSRDDTLTPICHACPAFVDFGVFIWTGKRWRIMINERPLSSIGKWGTAYPAGTVRLGPEIFGVVFDGWYGGQGHNNYTTTLFAVVKNKVETVLEIETGEDNRGARENDWTHANSMVTAIPGRNPNWYDIVVRTRTRRLVKGKIKTTRAFKRYVFKKGKYRLVKPK